MNRITVLMVGSLVLLVGLSLLLRSAPERPREPRSVADVPQDVPKPPLIVFCAASNRSVLEQIKQDYEAECGVPVLVEYGPSQTLLATHEISQTGDLYLPADDSFIEQAHHKKLIQEVLPLAQMKAVLAVAKGNPKRIQSLGDVLQNDVKLVQANPEAAAIGMLTKAALMKVGQWESLAAKSAYKTTVNEVANDLKVGSADVGIVFDAVLNPLPELEAVRIPELDSIVAKIAVSVLRSSQQPQRALHFARYLQAADRGQKHYRAAGFEPLPLADEWAETPGLTLFAGSMLRPAIEETIKRFEEREGVRVSRVYNGCGILVTQMKAGQIPDAYFACDSEFMQQVTDYFPRPTNVSQNELVILVAKGNPHGIKTLKDLGQPGLRVGIGHEKQCAMGWLTQKTLKEGKVQEDVMKNVAVQTPTGDMLVNQMKTGSLDAAVAYLSNAAGSGDVLDAIRIKDIPCSVATQPFAVAKSSTAPRLAARLAEALKSAESRERFLIEGFRWQVAE